MLRSKANICVIRPMSQLASFKSPISSYSQITRTKNQINEQAPMRQDTEKAFKRGAKISVLVTTLIHLENSKEAVYGALDGYVADEPEFPIGRLKTALIALEKNKQWHRVVQLIKWMLSKGQCVTVKTYGQLIHALDMDHRVEEANNLWGRKLGRNLESVPWKVCDIMISVYYRNQMWEQLVNLFQLLEAHGRKPKDQSVVRKVAQSYDNLGLLEQKQRVCEKYKSLFTKTRGKYGRKHSKHETKISSEIFLETND